MLSHLTHADRRVSDSVLLGMTERVTTMHSDQLLFEGWVL